MDTHPYFDLRLHTDAEISALLGAAVVERVTLHEWPLSCVQRLQVDDGRCVVYKSQFGPTVEASFYARATSPLLLPAQTLYADQGYVILLFDSIDAPRLCDLTLPRTELVAIGRQLCRQISQVTGDLPVYLDLRTTAKWQQIMAETLAALARLVETKRFVQVTAAHLHTLAQQVNDEAVLAALAGPSGLVHGDLTGENVFVLPDGLRVIDWQRPLLGPPDLDLATLVEAAGVDPRPYVAAGIMPLLALLRVQWFTACAAHWFPAGCETYDRLIAGLVMENTTTD